MKETDFRLSRVHAAGWNAARHFPIADGEPNAAEMDALNPHRKDPERARWITGFRAALGLDDSK